MNVQSFDCPEYESLRSLVQQTLCEHEQLEPSVFPLTEQILKQQGEPCGIFFCLHGPRSVRYTAIWQVQRRCVMFYGSTGERFCTIRLRTAPVLPMSLECELVG
jgi:hypothetical protein